jgi:hypothetical protein
VLEDNHRKRTTVGDRFNTYAERVLSSRKEGN